MHQRTAFPAAACSFAMIVDENVSVFIDSLYKDGDAFMEALREEAERDSIPIIRRQSEGFLKSLLLMKRPQRILEIGTGIAYSSIFMAFTLPQCTVTTVENYAPRITRAKENIKKALLQERIKLVEGDAAEVLPSLEGSYDFVFLDGPKGQYAAFLPEILRLLEDGGVLLADNVLAGGSIALSRFALERRQRTIHERLREFLRDITRCPELETSILTVADGMSLSVKLPEKPDSNGFWSTDDTEKTEKGY